MADTFFFNGNTYTSPKVVSNVNDTGFTGTSLGSGNNFVAVGVAQGGQPNTVYSFSSPEQAEAVLIGGDLMTAINKAFSASTDSNVGTPAEVMAVVVGEATPATLVLKNSAGTAVITLTSTQYGLPANQTKISIQPGSLSTYQLPTMTVSVQNLLTQAAPTVAANLSLLAFTVSYTGTQASATITVNDTEVILSAPTGTPVATILFSQATTVDQLVDLISGVPGFAAVMGPSASGTPTAASLDWVTGAQSLATPVAVTATTQAVVNFLNSNQCQVCTAQRTAGLGAQLAPISWTFLTGGTAPAPLVSDWANAFVVLQSANVQHVAALSANPAVWALLSAHVSYMSNVAFKPRRGYAGPALGTTITAAEAIGMGINSDRVAICFPGYQDYNVAGQLVTLPSYQTAALVAAMFAGSAPGMPMTNKSINVVGMEIILNDPTDTDGLIQSGIMPVTVEDGVYKVVRSVSTWLTNNAFDKVEVSTGIAVDFVLTAVRLALKPYVGLPVSPTLLGLEADAIKAVLAAMAVPASQGGPGVLVGNPAFKNIQVTAVGDSTQASWVMSPCIPNNFIAVSTTLQAYSGTASA